MFDRIKWRTEHKEESKAYAKDYREKQKKTAIFHYSNGTMKCVCCNESDIMFLTIDHINGGGRKHAQEIGGSGSVMYWWLIKNGFPEGFQVLCFNCNCGRDNNNGTCPHKKDEPVK